MTTEAAEAPVRRGQYIWLKADTYADLKEYRRGDEHFSDVVARLLRFAKRYAPAAEAMVREDFLP